MSSSSLTSTSISHPSRASASPWAWVGGLVVTIGLLAWALHGISAPALIGHLQRANVGWLLGAVALATLTFPLRTVRWRLILRDESGRGFPLRPLRHATAIGLIANNILPVPAPHVSP